MLMAASTASAAYQFETAWGDSYWEHLTLEITESALVQTVQAVPVLSELRARGARVAEIVGAFAEETDAVPANVKPRPLTATCVVSAASSPSDCSSRVPRSGAPKPEAATFARISLTATIYTGRSTSQT